MCGEPECPMLARMLDLRHTIPPGAAGRRGSYERDVT
jgi:hypothetical protein